MSNTLKIIDEKYNLVEKLKSTNMINNLPNKDVIIEYLYDYVYREYFSMRHAYETDNIFIEKFINRFFEQYNSNLVDRIKLKGKQLELTDSELEVVTRQIGNSSLGTSQPLTDVEVALTSIANQGYNITKLGKFRAYFNSLETSVNESIKPFINSFNSLFSINQSIDNFDEDCDNYATIEDIEIAINTHNLDEFSHPLILEEINNLNSKVDTKATISDIVEEVFEHNRDLNAHRPLLISAIEGYILEHNVDYNSHLDIRREIENAYSTILIKGQNGIVSNLNESPFNNIDDISSSSIYFITGINIGDANRTGFLQTMVSSISHNFRTQIFFPSGTNYYQYFVRRYNNNGIWDVWVNPFEQAEILKSIVKDLVEMSVSNLSHINLTNFGKTKLEKFKQYLEKTED